MSTRTDSARAGFNLIEVMVAMSVAAVVILAIGGFIVTSFKSGVNEKDRAFAMQRAMQMMEELAAYQKTGPADTGIVKFNQGTLPGGAYSFQLTTEANAVAYSSFSGNPIKNGNYKYVRHVDVAPVTSDPSAMEVTVSVFYAANGTTPTPDPKRTRPLAVVSNHLRTAPGTVGATQALDVYVISIENVPHVFRKVNNEYYYPSATEARLAFDQSMRNFTSAYPGITLRPHYITRMSMGRDAYYRPYVNSAKGITGAGPEDVKWVYWYPGKLDNSPDGGHIFDEQTISGNIGVGNALGAGIPAGNYPIADQFNHAVPYPEEHTFAAPNDVFGAAAVPANFPTSDSISGMSLRQFLEDLLEDDTGKYRNAMVVNLHGELFPCLPLRPYSDPAKDPAAVNATFQKRRIVTHPYRMNFKDVGDVTKPPVRLNVYTYNIDGSDTTPWPDSKVHDVWTSTPYDSDTAGHQTGANAWAREARIIIKDVKNDILGAAPPLDGVVVTAIQRDRTNGNLQNVAYTFAGDGGDDKGAYAANELWPVVSDDDDPARHYHSGPHLKCSHNGGLAAPANSKPHFVGNDLVFDLADLDYDCHQMDDGGLHYGIDHTQTKEMLHNLQYFPDPYLEYLDEDGDKQTRNTTRMTIELDMKASAANKRYTVITQLNTAAGYVNPTTNPDDPTLTKTYFYTGLTMDPTQKLYYSGGGNPKPTIPWTDQVQLTGDPRHVPYADMRENNNVNLYWSNFDNGHKIYGDFDNTAGHRIDKGNADAAVPSASSSSGGSHGHGHGHGGHGHGHSTVTFPDVSVPEAHDSWNTTKFNGPAYFRMWREAMYRNNLIFVNVAGEPMGYIGLGGEFTLDKKINESANINFIASIYNNTHSLEPGRSELDTEVPLIVKTGWASRPWLGELYPMSEWANWSTKGNLPTSTYIHENLTDVGNDAGFPGGLLDINENEDRNNNTKHLSPRVGLQSFLNAPVNTADVTSPGNQNSHLLALGTGIGKGFGVNLQELKSEFPYQIIAGTPGTKTTEYSDAWYTSRREPCYYLNDYAGISMSGYFSHDSGGYYASNPIVMTDVTGVRQAIFLANAFRPESIDKLPKVFDNAVATMVQTYFDSTRDQAGRTLGLESTKPLPRVLLTAPIGGAQLSGGSALLTWTKTWDRPDATPYSLTNTYDGNLAVASGGPLPVVYFLKYRSLSGSSEWQMAKLSSAPVVNLASWVPALPTDQSPYRPGVVPVAAPMPTLPNTALGATWDISGLATGDYLLRLEAYRQDPTSIPANFIVPTHYAYHEIKVTRN
ncbi:MAG: hypothetical protein JWM80_1408 [Cyanobacteria bacterium RYN_339]|nr:hypothetical protein [Cyanobacteria bacterium RYN_339]